MQSLLLGMASYREADAAHKAGRDNVRLAGDRSGGHNGWNEQSSVSMSLYALQKLIRDVNRKPACREAYFQSAAKFAEGYDLAADERSALIDMNVGRLYAMGVHGLLLRPFTLLHQMPEPDYLKAIRGE